MGEEEGLNTCLHHSDWLLLVVVVDDWLLVVVVVDDWLLVVVVVDMMVEVGSPLQEDKGINPPLLLPDGNAGANKMEIIVNIITAVSVK